MKLEEYTFSGVVAASVLILYKLAKAVIKYKLHCEIDAQNPEE